MEERSEASKGVIFALLAFFSWGLFPAYWKLLSHVPPWEVASYRMIGSAITYFFILRFRGVSIKTPTSAPFRLIFLSATLISSNWLLYVFAVNTGHVVETSLGYFITPLVNVGLGAWLLKEKLSRKKWLAVGLAASGVIKLSLLGTGVPWIAILLAATFGSYGLLRKKMHTDPLGLSFWEALSLTPFAISALLAFGSAPPSAHDVFFLVLGGPVTAFPLLWFAEAAKRLPLSTMGFFQYIAPSMQFILGVWAYSEPFSLDRFTGFLLVWVALFVFAIPMPRPKARI